MLLSLGSLLFGLLCLRVKGLICEVLYSGSLLLMVLCSCMVCVVFRVMKIRVGFFCFMCLVSCVRLGVERVLEGVFSFSVFICRLSWCVCSWKEWVVCFC